MAKRTTEQQEPDVAALDLPQGITLGEAQPAPVGQYDERPYVDALTDEHREVLTRADQLPQ